jgi:hypothetical protein
MGMGTGLGGGQVKPRAQHVVEPITDVVAHGASVELERGVLGDVLRGAPLALLIVDHMDRICFANDAASALLGRGADDLQHAVLHHHVALHHRNDDGSAGGSAFRHAAWSSATLTATLPDGRPAQAKFSVVRDRFGKMTHASVALEPIATGAEDALLELLGRLSGELAHDINNHLSAALNYVFILRRRLSSEPVNEHLEELQAAIWRASGLTSTIRRSAASAAVSRSACSPRRRCARSSRCCATWRATCAYRCASAATCPRSARSARTSSRS